MELREQTTDSEEPSFSHIDVLAETNSSQSGVSPEMHGDQRAVTLDNVQCSQFLFPARTPSSSSCGDPDWSLEQNVFSVQDDHEFTNLQETMTHGHQRDASMDKPDHFLRGCTSSVSSDDGTMRNLSTASFESSFVFRSDDNTDTYHNVDEEMADDVFVSSHRDSTQQNRTDLNNNKGNGGVDYFTTNDFNNNNSALDSEDTINLCDVENAVFKTEKNENNGKTYLPQCRYAQGPGLFAPSIPGTPLNSIFVNSAQTLADSCPGLRVPPTFSPGPPGSNHQRMSQSPRPSSTSSTATRLHAPCAVAPGSIPGGLFHGTSTVPGHDTNSNQPISAVFSSNNNNSSTLPTGPVIPHDDSTTPHLSEDTLFTPLATAKADDDISTTPTPPMLAADGFTDHLDLTGSPGVHLLDQETSGCPGSGQGVSNSLKNAACRAVQSGRLSPLLKIELKYLIQSRRVSEGKGEMDVTFEPPSDAKLSSWEMAKVERRRHQNREAAKRFREKRKTSEAVLMQKIKALNETNAQLAEQAKQLREEKQLLMETVADHLLICPCLGQVPLEDFIKDAIP